MYTRRELEMGPILENMEEKNKGIAEWKTKRKLGNAAPGLQSAKKVSRFFLLA